MCHLLVSHSYLPFNFNLAAGHMLPQLSPPQTFNLHLQATLTARERHESCWRRSLMMRSESKANGWTL